MSLSWGERHDKPAPRFPAAALVIAVMALLTAPIADVNADIARDQLRAEIEAAVVSRQRALVAHDLEAFLATIDPERGPLRDCERQFFELAGRVAIAQPRPAVGRIDATAGYVRAWVEDAAGWERHYFRRVGDRWFISEPTLPELGGEKQREISGIRVRYYAVDEDVASILGDELDRIRFIVSERAPAPPSTLFTIRIVPLAAQGDRCFFAGQAERTFAGTAIELRRLRLNQQLTRLSEASVDTIEHEAMHWLQFDYAGNAVALVDWWIVEGLPQWVTERPAPAVSARAVCSSSLPSEGQLSLGPRGALPEETFRYYVLAATMFELLSDTYGRDSYWRLIAAFRSTRERSAAYLSALGVAPQAAYDTLARAMTTRYCR